MDMNHQNEHKGSAPQGSLRDRIRRAADSLKEKKAERAKNMSEETLNQQETAQETEAAQETVLDAAALAAELEKTKA